MRPPDFSAAADESDGVRFPPAALLPAPKIRVYLVDDHALLRRGLVALLSGEPDMEVCGEAGDCATATAEIFRLRPDVVVADLVLAGNNGLELIKNVRSMKTETQVVVFSAHDESNYAVRSIKAGARAYISKRDPASALVDALRASVLSPETTSKFMTTALLESVTQRHNYNADSPVAALSDRELEVVTLIGGGLDTREIARRLNVSEKTVAAHRLNLKGKLGLRTASQVVHFCTRWTHEHQWGPV